ncbi:MAG: hypothetical protein Q9199_007216 [Rusavskia elegans]
MDTNTTDNTPDTYLPMKGSSATAPANKQSPKRTIPYPDEDDISEAAATDDNNDDDNSTKNANGHAIDPKPKPADVAPAKTTGTMSEDDTTDKAAAAAPAANGNVVSPAQ